MTSHEKERVREYWDASACGEVLLEGTQQFENQARARYELEPYIAEFARFADGLDKDVLEIGVGLGADHREWARASPRRLCGIDLTPRAIELTRTRFAILGLESELAVGDAEHLRFDDASFDIVYSYGVLHHTPDTQRAIDEVWRVLRPGGSARIMIYHSPSIVGMMLWVRYALLRGQPQLPLNHIYARFLESPGTKAYGVAEARAMLRRFSSTEVRVQLSHGDLLEGPVGQRHGGIALKLAKRLWPRRALKQVASPLGTALLIHARK